MARKGRLGQRMMKQTAGVQSNLDYSDEADAMRKLRVSMGFVPLVYAMFANSPLSDGGLNGYHELSRPYLDRYRSRPLRYPADSPSIPTRASRDYVEYALDVPMYLLIRDHEYIDLTRPPGITFRQYMERGLGGSARPSEDWANHLTTIFTEVRLKKYIEVRTADSQPPALMLALPALLKGVLYDDDCLGAAWDLVKRWSFDERLELTGSAHQIGLEARAGPDQLQGTGAGITGYRDGGLWRDKEH